MGNTCCERWWISKESEVRSSLSSLPSFRFRISGKPRCEVALPVCLSVCDVDEEMRATRLSEYQRRRRRRDAVQEDNANVRLPRRRASFLPPRDCLDDGDKSTAGLSPVWDHNRYF